MVESALSFLLGILLIQQFSGLPEREWLLPVGIVLGLLFYQRYWRCCFLVAGLLWAWLFAMHRLADRLPETMSAQDFVIKAKVISLPEQDEKRVRFDAEVLASATPLPKQLRLSWYYSEQPVKAGQLWAMTVRLKRPHGTFNSAGFDYERWLFIQGIGATGYVRAEPAPQLLGPASGWLSMPVWRQHIADRLTDLLGTGKNAALIKALTIGDGSSISQQQWQVFRKTGTIHLVVISGSHIALIAGLVYLLVLKLWARTGLLCWAPQKVAALTAMLAGFFYAGLAGFSVPTQRALIMLSVAMCAVILQRNSRPLNVLALAMFAVLLVEPVAVLAAGFWLSFGAVAVIIFISSGRLAKPGYLAGAWQINWVTSLGLAPLLLLFFQQLSLIAPLANMLAVPVISIFVVPIALLAVFLMLIAPELAAQLFYPVDLALQGLWWLLVRLAELPFAVINHAAPPLWALGFLLPGLLLLFAPKGMPARYLSLVLFLPALITDAKPPALGAVKMTLLDVGQGLAAVVQTATHFLVFDTGAKFSNDSDMGRSVLLPFLWAQGLQSLDALIVSHGDNDHIGGAQSLLAELPATQLLTSVPQQLAGYAPTPCRAGQSWQWDQVTFSILSPDQELSSDNDNSCVLKIQSAYGSALLPADIEVDAEARLVQRYGSALSAAILVAPHHGSKTSSSWSFLQTVKPDYVLIPAGYQNQFGHPHPEVLQRYRQLNSQWLSSAEHGAIEVKLEPGHIDVQCLRASAARYWNNRPQ